MSYPERVWIGPHYESLRIFVLGESWYGDYRGNLATDAGYIAAYLADKQIDRMYTKMANATGLGKRKFWESVAFTNFVQRVGATLDCRPTPQHFLDAQDRLRRLLSKHRPKGVWILGTEQGAYSEPVVRAAGVACAISPHPTRHGVTNAWLGEGWHDLMTKLQGHSSQPHARPYAQPLGASGVVRMLSNLGPLQPPPKHAKIEGDDTVKPLKSDNRRPRKTGLFLTTPAGTKIELQEYPFPESHEKFSVFVNGAPTQAACTRGVGRSGDERNYTYIKYAGRSLYVNVQLDAGARVVVA
jgi:hypothetical protein